MTSRVDISPPASSEATPDSKQRPEVEATSWTGRPLPPEADDKLVGTTLHDTYAVERILGEGGMGRIYEARHTRLPKKRFAIKVLHTELATNSDLQARFQREAETAASIEHPNVMGTYDIGRTPQGWQYIVCEHLRGIDLHTQLTHWGPVALPTLLHIGKRLCEGVDAAHQRGVIHRDLKPHNLFLVGDFSQGLVLRPHLKVLDFGLSRFVDHDSQLTKTGMIMGTPGYMSPEQARGGATDKRTDVYGAGTILYAMATGQAPFDEETPQMTILAVMNREPERPSAIEPKVPESLEIVIQRAMSKEPEQRYAGMRELHAALVALETGRPTSVLPEGTTAPPKRRREFDRAARFRFGTLLCATALALAGCATLTVTSYLALTSERIEFSTTEVALFIALAATSSFPLTLAVRHFRTRVWTNTAKVSDWDRAMRGALLASLASYGVAAITIRLGDSLLAGLDIGLWGVGAGVSYAGYGISLPVIAFTAFAAQLLRARLSRSGKWQLRLVLGPVLLFALVLGSAAGLRWTHQQRAASQRLGPTSAYGTPATAASLEEAQARGVDALRALAARHSSDRRVLRALITALSSSPDSRLEALEATRRLLVVAPEEASWVVARTVIAEALRERGHAAALAIHAATELMGERGADLLYESLARGGASRLAVKQALGDLRRKGLVSHALAVTLDLEQAPNCATRLELLPRARRVGDVRTSRALRHIADSTQACATGSPGCPSGCELERSELLEAANELSTRGRDELGADGRASGR